MDRRTWIASAAAGLVAGGIARADSGPEVAVSSPHLPDGVAPQIGCWFWSPAEFEPDGWRPSLELLAGHSPYRLLTTSIRAPLVEVTQAATREQIGRATEAARAHGIGIVMDLDVRLAREAFRAAHPHELQEMLSIRIHPVAGETTACRVESQDLDDHYTVCTTHYTALAGRVERVYAFDLAEDAIAAGSLLEITAACTVTEATPAAVAVAAPDGALQGRSHIALLAVFTHLAADVFAPHLMEFQREILRFYRELPLAGACKDEWGFPPCFDGNPAHNDVWFSPAMAEEYGRVSHGRDLVADALLMYQGEAGRDNERAHAVNLFQRMCWERHVALECDFHDAVRETFGPDALSATHPTWWPYPGIQEIKKNGLSWWGARRALAQTDEITPYCCRTALAKKWRSPAWWNMYYAPAVAEYEREVWASALAGGRVNYHPQWPVEGPIDPSGLLHAPLLRAECRVRLLNLITGAPLDCPAAVVFGHWSAMNWAGGSYPDSGVALAERFWSAGYPADLIPSSELLSGALDVDRDGWVRYGDQRYTVLLVANPEFEGEDLTRFLRRSVEGPTTVCTVGSWTRGFDGVPLADAAPAGALSAEETVDALIRHLEDLGVPRHSPAIRVASWGLDLTEPALDGHSRMLDGTRVFVRASTDPAGDPFSLEEDFGGHPVAARAEGLLAVRLDARGRLEALAAGGLSAFRGGGVRIDLPQPIDLALRRDTSGRLVGWIQAYDGPLPKELLRLTSNWRRLALPSPLV